MSGLKKQVYGYNQAGELIHEFKSTADAERSLGLYTGSVSEYITKHKRPYKGVLWGYEKRNGTDLKKVPQPSQSFNYMNENELKQKHDQFTILMNEVKKIPEGRFIEESQILRKAGLWGKPGYRSTSDRPEFKQFRGKADGTVYFGHEKSIQKLKMEGVLS